MVQETEYTNPAVGRSAFSSVLFPAPLGAKANDVQISQLVVACKSEMEKIREQIQNIE